MNKADTESERERLKAEIGLCAASDLKAHVVRGVVIVVSADLSLLDVACAVAEDDSARVSSWIEAAQIAQPSLEQLKLWEAEPDTPLYAVIVRPYVLVAPLDKPDANPANKPS